jgi:glycosyltransferase involved in cell wall biosynthesis
MTPPQPPKITVVTPSYNQGQFLEETIASVLAQNYPNLEYMILDGGSADNSVEIIRKYEKYLAYWVSEPDGGQSAAINRGFKAATGDILAWLNSDDMYLPGALQYVATNCVSSEPKVVFGNCMHFDNERPEEARGSHVRRAHQQRDIMLADYIVQPSSFFTRAAWLEVGPLNPSLAFGFDWEWYIRAKQRGVYFQPVDKYLACYRIHASHKSAAGGSRRLDELAEIYKSYAGARYAVLFRDACRQNDAIQRTRKWIYRLRLSRYEASVLRVMFPGLFHGFADGEISDVLAMVG